MLIKRFIMNILRNIKGGISFMKQEHDAIKKNSENEVHL
jgi:hypothetical protein